MKKSIIARWEYMLLPLFLINITTSANTWAIFGISIGQLFFYILIAVVIAVVAHTPYRNLGFILFVFSFGYIRIYGNP